MDATTSNFNSSDNAAGPVSTAAGFTPPGAGDATGGPVVSLDSALVKQAKSEIRTLASEIAKLAHSDISADEFYQGFLTRLCTAIGASAAAVWRIAPSGTRLEAAHALSAELCRADSPTRSHASILDSVCAEGQPILVPPGSVKLQSERPSNPTEQTLIIVPVAVQDSDIEYLLEVVQRPSGGPTAQRGYLRFVAQMADLMADFLRRGLLRNLSIEREHLKLLEAHLVSIASASTFPKRAQRVTDAIWQLCDCQQVYMLSGPERRVLAVSGCSEFDPRSQSILAANALCSALQADSDSACPAQCDEESDSEGEPATKMQTGCQTPAAAKTYRATDRRQAEDEQSIATPFQAVVDAFCDAVGGRFITCLPMPQSNVSLLLVDSDDPLKAEVYVASARWPDAMDTLLADVPRGWQDRLRRRLLRRRTEAGSAYQRTATWVARACMVAICIMVGMFPVSQHVTAPATLHPSAKQPYYAPASGQVVEVLVDEGQLVAPGESLLRLSNRQLESRLEALQSELELAQEQLAEQRQLLARGGELSLQESDRIESKLQQLQISRRSLLRQQEIVAEQVDSLEIRAETAGEVASFDLRNRLLHRPVQAGDLLITTFLAEEPWYLRIAVQDHRIGLVSEAMAASDAGARVQFALSSHPDQIHEGLAARMASQATSIGAADRHTNAGGPSVAVDAMIPAGDLPLRKDGAIANATIECGRVPLAWLVFRDAYLAVSSRLQMLW